MPLPPFPHSSVPLPPSDSRRCGRHWQTTEQADVIAAAIAAAARTHQEHREEVAVLSEKLRQVLGENDGLRLLAETQKSDLEVLSNEMVRLLPTRSFG